MGDLQQLTFFEQLRHINHVVCLVALCLWLVGVHVALSTPQLPFQVYIWGVFTPKTARARAPGQILRQFFRPIGEATEAVLTW